MDAQSYAPSKPEGRLAAPELARRFGLDRRTINEWCRDNPNLAVRWDGQWWLAPADLDAFLARRRAAREDAARQRAAERQAAERRRAADGEGAALAATHLTSAAAAKTAGVTQAALFNWCRAHPELGVFCDRRWWIDRQALAAFLERRRATPRALARQKAAQRNAGEDGIAVASHLTPARAAERAGVSTAAVYGWCRKTPGLAAWYENRWWIVPEALDAFLATRRGGGHAQG